MEIIFRTGLPENQFPLRLSAALVVGWDLLSVFYPGLNEKMSAILTKCPDFQYII